MEFWTLQGVHIKVCKVGEQVSPTGPDVMPPTGQVIKDWMGSFLWVYILYIHYNIIRINKYKKWGIQFLCYQSTSLVLMSTPISSTFPLSYVPPQLLDIGFLAIWTFEHSGKSRRMPKEACEITVPKTSKQKSGIHVKIDIAKNLELTKYFFLNILIHNSNNHDNLICIHRKKDSTFVRVASMLYFWQ